MTYRLDFDQRDAVIALIFSGDVSAAELEPSRADLVAALEASGRRRVLVDFTWAVARVLVEDVFALAASHAEVFPPATRVAVVVPPKLAELAAFSVTVARNRGFSMQAFGDAEAAARWLDA